MPLRSMANTTLSLPGGLVSVPVKMYAATGSDNQVKFNLFHVHSSDGSAARINQPRICSGCGEAVEQRDLVRGVERNGQAILVTDDELEQVQSGAGTAFEILRFVDSDEISPLLYGSPYFLGPDLGTDRSHPRPRNPRAPETYQTLLTALEKNKRVAVVQYTMRSRTHLAMLRVATVEGTKVLVIQNLIWPSELRTPVEVPHLDAEVNLNTRSLKLMEQLIEQETEPFDAEQYVDSYNEGVKELLDCKEAGVPMAFAGVQPLDDVTDLMAALEKSIAAKAKSKASHPAGRRAPAKKAAAKAPTKVAAAARRTRKTA